MNLQTIVTKSGKWLQYSYYLITYYLFPASSSTHQFNLGNLTIVKKDNHAYYKCISENAFAQPAQT